MLIGGDDISNDVNTLGTSFSMFFYIRVRFRFADWQKSHSSVHANIIFVFLFDSEYFPMVFSVMSLRGL